MYAWRRQITAEGSEPAEEIAQALDRCV